MDFKLHSEYQPTGDQPQAIKELVDGFKKGNQFQTLLGVTGSGKTFTMANVIEQLNKPTLVLAHNKTLAAQLYSEFREFFPENAVEYFVSYCLKSFFYYFKCVTFIMINQVFNIFTKDYLGFMLFAYPNNIHEQDTSGLTFI